VGNKTASDAGSSGATSSTPLGSKADGQGVAQSGVQHPIFSWSAALPVSAPGIVARGVRP
jgi:hypothetical protein